QLHQPPSCRNPPAQGNSSSSSPCDQLTSLSMGCPRSLTTLAKTGGSAERVQIGPSSSITRSSVWTWQPSVATTTRSLDRPPAGSRTTMRISPSTSQPQKKEPSSCCSQSSSGPSPTDQVAVTSCKGPSSPFTQR